MRPNTWLALLATVAAACLTTTVARAQPGSPAGFVSRLDRFGNAEFANTDRRFVGQFQSAAQRVAAQGYQDFGRRPERRQLSLRGGVQYELANIGRFRSALIPLASGLGEVSYGSGGISYGSGFIGSAPRLISRPGEIDDILARRYELLAESSLFNPVEEIQASHRRAAGLPTGRQGVAFSRLMNSIPPSAQAWRTRATTATTGAQSAVSSDTESGTTPTSGGSTPTVQAGLPLPLYGTQGAGDSEAYATTSLGLRLQHALSHEKYSATLTQAWANFADGRFHRAIRLFERAQILEPDASEPLLGQLFSQVANGSIRTAAALLRIVSERADLLLSDDVRLPERFNTPREATTVRLAVESAARSASATAEVHALHALLLWQLGERQAARQVASQLEREFATSAYAGWREIMDRIGG